MELLQALKFVKAVVRKNKISADFEHFRIKDGTIVGFNGHMALGAPVDLDFEAHPQAAMFSKACEACSDAATSLHMTPAHRLAVKSGGFKAFVPCLPEISFDVEPKGEVYEMPAGFAAEVEKLRPFVADDATRPWAMGLLIADGLLTATNNVVLVQAWTGHKLPRLNIPKFALGVLARVGADPVSVQTDGHTVTFHYEDGRWLRTNVYGDEWPLDKLQQIVEVEHTREPVTESFRDAVRQLEPFCENKTDPVYFGEGEISTSTADGDGVVVACDGIPDGPVFSIGQLSLVVDVVEHVDWSLYPRPCIFYGPSLRGAIVGRNY